MENETSTEWGVAWAEAPEHERYEECRDEQDARRLARQYVGDLLVVQRTVTRSAWVVAE